MNSMEMKEQSRSDEKETAEALERQQNQQRNDASQKRPGTLPAKQEEPTAHVQKDRKISETEESQSFMKSTYKSKGSSSTYPLPLTSLEHTTQMTEPGAHRIGGMAHFGESDEEVGDAGVYSSNSLGINEEPRSSYVAPESALRVSKLIQAELVVEDDRENEGSSAPISKSPMVEAQVLETTLARFRRRVLVAIIFCASMIGMTLAVVFTVRDDKDEDDDNASLIVAMPSVEPSSAPTRQIFELVDTLDGRQQIGLFDLEAPVHSGGHFGYYTSIFDLSLNPFLSAHTDKKIQVTGSYGTFPQYYSSGNATPASQGFQVDLESAFSFYLCTEESCEVWFSFSPPDEPILGPWHIDSSYNGDFFAFATHYGLDVFDMKTTNIFQATSIQQLTPVQPVNGPGLGTRRVAVSESGMYISAMSNTTVVTYTTSEGFQDDSVPILSRNFYNESDGQDQAFTIAASGTNLAVATRSQNDEPTDQVRVLNVETGQQIGQELHDAIRKNFGDGQVWSVLSDSSLSLSRNGTLLALGMRFLEQQDLHRNVVQIFHLLVQTNGNERWETLGQLLHGSLEESEFGHCIDMSDDGMTLAISAPFGDSGEVHTFRFDQSSTEWIRIGDILQDGVGFGFSLSITPDGEHLAVGNPFSSRTGLDTGEIHLFEISYT